MCRRNQLLGVFAMGLGVGLLAACWISSPFGCACVGIVAIIGGACLLQRAGKRG